MPPLSADALALLADRRRRLMDGYPEGTLAVFPSAPVRARNGDVDYPYRQDSDLVYLTGFPEPETLALLEKTADGVRFELLVRPRDPERETWEGRRAGVEGAMASFGADEARPIGEWQGRLEALLLNREHLAYAIGSHPETDGALLSVLARLRAGRKKFSRGPATLHDPAALLHEMRLFKGPAEIAAMQAAADASVEGHKAAMRACRPGLTERHVQAVLEGTFRAMGSPRNGYPSIVAGGVNATILHYNENDQPLDAGALLLIDAGAEVDFYTADITRTFPVSGAFSGPQRDLYDVVLAAQLASVDACRVGKTFEDVHDVTVRILTQGLVDLGFLEGDVDALVEDGAFRPYYMHRTSHWLGLDVHDVGRYRPGGQSSRGLEPGMALTVEPGLYVAPDAKDAPEAFRGLGIRIEDDVVVTDGAPVNLTEGVPKDPATIEALMAEPGPTLPGF